MNSLQYCFDIPDWEYFGSEAPSFYSFVGDSWIIYDLLVLEEWGLDQIFEPIKVKEFHFELKEGQEICKDFSAYSLFCPPLHSLVQIEKDLNSHEDFLGKLKLSAHQEWIESLEKCFAWYELVVDQWIRRGEIPNEDFPHVLKDHWRQENFQEVLAETRLWIKNRRETTPERTSDGGC